MIEFEPLVSDREFTPCLFVESHEPSCSPLSTGGKEESDMTDSSQDTLNDSSNSLGLDDALEAVEGVAAEPQIDIQQLISEAEERGRKAATEELAEQREKFQRRHAVLEELIETFEKARHEDQTQTREVFCALLMGLLQRLVGSNEALRSDALKTSIDEIVRVWGTETDVVVRVSAEQSDEANGLLQTRSGWTVLVDEKIHGGARGESDRGSIDATVNTAIQEIEATVTTWLREHQ